MSTLGSKSNSNSGRLESKGVEEGVDKASSILNQIPLARLNGHNAALDRPPSVNRGGRGEGEGGGEIWKKLRVNRPPVDFPRAIYPSRGTRLSSPQNRSRHIRSGSDCRRVDHPKLWEYGRVDRSVLVTREN